MFGDADIVLEAGAHSIAIIQWWRSNDIRHSPAALPARCAASRSARLTHELNGRSSSVASRASCYMQLWADADVYRILEMLVFHAAHMKVRRLALNAQ